MIDWINFSERRPRKNLFVLLESKHGEVAKGHWVNFEGEECAKIVGRERETYWMPELIQRWAIYND